MSKNIEVFDGQWYIKYVPSEEAAFIKTHEDVRFRTKNGYLTEKIERIQPQTMKSYQGFILITFEAPNAPAGRKSVRFDVSQLVLEKTSFRDLLSPLVMSTKQFCAAFTANVLKPAGGQGNEAAQEKEYEMPWTSDPMPSTSQAPAKKKRVSAGGKPDTDPVDLPSPNKQPKEKATTIDERIDSRYIGHLSLTLDSLSSDCPKAWLDREINPDHVKEVERALEKTPTIAKTMQSWIAIADIDKKDLTSKEMIKGCRITVIGGRHRHAAYKKVCQVSEVHEKELRKVWVHLYDNQLSDQEIRRLAAMHNTINVGSMSTPWLTRVHSCREWLYKSAGKRMEDDDTPPSTQAWKTACQMMYVSKDKDANTLEPTLQAALLRRDVYEQFRCVGELYSRGELKEQGATKRKRSAKTGEGITQSKLGMPLQGLTDDTKLALLKQVSKKEISLSEFKEKCQRIKKKQLIVNAFVKYAGEESYATLRARFPLHATEEKLAQFVSTNITKKSIPQEMIAFFERALKWENEKVSDTLNLHEERDGVYFFQRGESSAILLEGSLSNIPIKQVRRLITARPFKGFSLVLASLPKETTKKDLALFITNVHAANVDLLNNYNVAIITDEENVEMCREHIKHRLTQQQNAFWVNTKPQKQQGYMLTNNIRPIVFGHWAKEGAMTDSHCHFDDNESAGNTFCFEENDGHLPKSLLKHIVNHFSYKGQWILDLTASKESGIVATLASGRNCVSLMNSSDLRKTAEAAASSVNREDDITENDSENNEE